MTNGKGSKPRPLAIPREEYEKNWERAFGRRSSGNPPGNLSRTKNSPRP